MSDHHKFPAGRFDVVPDDLVALFAQNSNGDLSGREELEINLLKAEEAVEWTKDFRDFHPIVAALRGFILDDPNTSNHHVYLSWSACAGTVLFLDHDGDSRIVFATLQEFVHAISNALDSGRSLRSFHPASGVLLPDQPELSRLVADLYDGKYDCDGHAVILSLIPSMDLTDVSLLERLIVDQDFYLAGSIGDEIARRPRLDLLPIAKMCQNHPHFQAAKAGSRAMAAVAALER